MNLPYIALEDGFLRSIGLGPADPPLSIVVDDAGIYYDANRPSRLETFIARPLSDECFERARVLNASWRMNRISKYNHLPEIPEHLFHGLGIEAGRYVLVADQTFGDASIVNGMADPKSFARMLEAALDENPDFTVLLKIHPDVFAGKKRGHFEMGKLTGISRLKVLAENVHPVRLIECARAVYVVTSQLGFEGLLWGKPVRTFGMPFYAGWGLTEDELPAPDRRRPVSLESLVYGALIEYPRYIDPESGRRCEVERVVEWMGLQRRMGARFDREVYAIGFSRWKKPIVRDFFQGSQVRFVKTAHKAPSGANLAVWGRKPVRGGIPDGVSTVFLEDGFLRSVGLGADLVTPLSWVMDRRGIYYDATAPSDLEELLQTHSFDHELRDRARRLREVIVNNGITKYNVGSGEWVRPDRRAGRAGTLMEPQRPRRVIFVPGQVEKDASIQYGAAEIRTNLGLLKAVRKENPDTYVVYKPHPDVRAGLRASGLDEGEVSAWCDEIVGDVSMQAMLDGVDEVHVLTSLAGFEALLRGKRVVTYGQPFYAGWGLTIDMVPPPRRTRCLTLDELVAGALILYPTYVSRTTGRFTTPERALEELLEWRKQSASRMPFWRKWMRVVLRWSKG